MVPESKLEDQGGKGDVASNVETEDEARWRAIYGRVCEVHSQMEAAIEKNFSLKNKTCLLYWRRRLNKILEEYCFLYPMGALRSELLEDQELRAICNFWNQKVENEHKKFLDFSSSLQEIRRRMSQMDLKQINLREELKIATGLECEINQFFSELMLGYEKTNKEFVEVLTVCLDSLHSLKLSLTVVGGIFREIVFQRKDEACMRKYNKTTYQFWDRPKSARYWEEYLEWKKKLGEFDPLLAYPPPPPSKEVLQEITRQKKDEVYIQAKTLFTEATKEETLAFLPQSQRYKVALVAWCRAQGFPGDQIKILRLPPLEMHFNARRYLAEREARFRKPLQERLLEQLALLKLLAEVLARWVCYWTVRALGYVLSGVYAPEGVSRSSTGSDPANERTPLGAAAQSHRFFGTTETTGISSEAKVDHRSGQGMSLA